MWRLDSFFLERWEKEVRKNVKNLRRLTPPKMRYCIWWDSTASQFTIMKLRRDEKHTETKNTKNHHNREFFHPTKKKRVLSVLDFLTRSHFSACVNWKISRARVRRYKIWNNLCSRTESPTKKEDISTKREEGKVKIYTCERALFTYITHDNFNIFKH